MTFHENLLKQRKLKGFTQDDFAQKMQVSRQSVSKWENGETIPDLAKIIKIADILDISIDELCGRKDKKENITEANQTSNQGINSKNKVYRFTHLLFIVIIVALCSIGGFYVGQINSKSLYNLPTNIDVAGLTFTCETGILKCNFVPEVYSDKLNYTVILMDAYGNKKADTVTFKNGIGYASIPSAYDTSYEVILEISNGKENRNITLAKRLFADNANNTVTWE